MCAVSKDSLPEEGMWGAVSTPGLNTDTKRSLHGYGQCKRNGRSSLLRWPSKSSLLSQPSS